MESIAILGTPNMGLANSPLIYLDDFLLLPLILAIETHRPLGVVIANNLDRGQQRTVVS